MEPSVLTYILAFSSVPNLLAYRKENGSFGGWSNGTFGTLPPTKSSNAETQTDLGWGRDWGRFMLGIARRR
ncbi:hypothetical protein F5Y14DRAFT_446536 [Nemania sp. NC0429]|nr:hypothetical protein F5Y14DRAFT_446536 [Nemania sp. NC0429]